LLIKETPYWWEEAPRTGHAKVDLPPQSDVAIVGAGFSGLCTALVLARAGLSVTVFEAGGLGCGASTLNGGMVGPSFHKLGVVGLENKFGRDQALGILKESIQFVDFIEGFLKLENIDADFSRVGRFRGALNLKSFDAMSKELAILQETIGVTGRVVLKKDLSEETGSSLFQGGVVYHQDGGLHPGKYHDGLVRNVKAAGVKIIARTRVNSIEKKGDEYLLETASGSVLAEKVVVCTNGYTDNVAPPLKRRVLPIRSAMIATEPLPSDLIEQLMPKSRLYGDSRRLVAYYRPSPDGKRILFGGRASSLKDKPRANLHNLKKAMVEVYPQLNDVAISHVWSGLVAYTFDHIPHLGKYEGEGLDGVYYAMGYCGSGVARSSYFGTKLGFKILGSEKGTTAFDDLKFQSFPLYNGNPWFMPFLLAWHSLSDRFGR
jgi:glycine/D-amino acid oxidase-like deaminating enzyme